MSDNQNLPRLIGMLSDVRAGKADYFARDKLSAINKYPVQGEVAVNYLGLVTDEQADRRHHGGHLKAVHQMPVTTYAKINAAFGMDVAIGTLGENLTVTTPDVPMQECNVCIGDVYRFGEDDASSVKLRVVQPRRPCFKINDQLGRYGVASFISQQGIAGWYFQVVQDGKLSAGLPVYLVARPYAFADLATLWQLANQKGKLTAEVVEPWLAIDCLEDTWQAMLAKKRAQ